MSAEHVQIVLDLGDRVDLTPAARLLLLAYAHHVGPDGMCSKSFRQLGKMCGLCMQTLFTAKKTLEDEGLILNRTLITDALKNRALQKIEQNALKNRATTDALKNRANCSKKQTTLARVLINNQEINNSRSNAGARVREDFVTSGLTHPPRPEAPKGTPEAQALNKLCEAWPKRTLASSPGVRAAWIDILAEGVTPDELMACLGMAKTSKQWLDEYPRYVPQLANWLQGRQFAADLGKIRAERNRLAAERQRKADEESLNALVYDVDDFEEGEDDEFD